MKNIITYTVCLTLIFAAEKLSADAVFYQGGGYVEGKIISENDSSVTISRTGSENSRIDRKKISRTAYGDEYKEKKFIYTIDGKSAAGFIVGETKDTYFLKSELKDSGEIGILKSTVNFISKRKIESGGKEASSKIRVVLVEFDSSDADKEGMPVSIMFQSKINNTGRFILKGKALKKESLEKQNLNSRNPDYIQSLGRIYSVDTVITGSVSRSGDDLVITAKSTRCSNSREIASGTVTVRTVDELNPKLDELAHLVSGFSPAQYDDVLDGRALRMSRFGAGLGLSATIMTDRVVDVPKPGEDDSGGYLNIYYYSYSLETDFVFGGAPVFTFLNIHSMYYPVENFGIGGGISLFKTDNAVNEFTYKAFLFGIGWRPSSNFRFAIYSSIPVSGAVSYRKDQSSLIRDYPISLSDYELLYSSWIFSAEYRITKSFSLKGVFMSYSGVGTIADSMVTADYPKHQRTRTLSAGLIALYGFEF